MKFSSVLARVFPGAVKKIRDQQRTETIGVVKTAMAQGRSGGMFYGQKWPGGLSSPNPTLIMDHQGLRKQARAAEQLSVQARALIESDVDITVDSGMVMVPEPRYEVLGITQEEAEDWASVTKDAFDLWMQDKRMNRSEKFNGYQLQRLIGRYRARDNEGFVRHFYSPDPSLLSPLQVEVIDPDQTRGNGYTVTSGGNFKQDDGIVVDEKGREIGYKIWQDIPGKYQTEPVTVPRFGPKSGRVFMTHGFSPTFAGQTRGFSQLGVSIQDLELILDFSMAQGKKAINQSNIYVFGENSEGNVVDPLEFMKSGGAGPTGGTNPPQPTDPEAREILESLYAPIPEATIATPGSVGIFNAPKGQTLKPFTNTAPSEQFKNFVDAFFAYVAASQGTSIDTVLKKFGSNYNANRATLIMCWRVAIQRRYQIACDHLDPWYESWLSERIASGKTRCPGWQDPELRAAWLSHRWVGVSMPNMDPLKTMEAAEKAVELGATDLDDIATEYNGSNGASNRAKLARQLPTLVKDPLGRNAAAKEKAAARGLAPKSDPEDDTDPQEDGE